MKYRELVIEVKKEDLQEVLDALTAIDINSLMIDDPDDAIEIKSSPESYKYDYLSEEIEMDRRKKARVSAFFNCDEEGLEKLSEAEGAIQRLHKTMAEDSLNYYDQETADDSTWLYKWQENFKPTKVGEHFVVKPSWEEYDAKDGELVIEMDPGMAFGSGLHETTTLCMKALETAVKSESTVLDVGTGTGILAIAAAMLGAERCLGIDIDADAVRIAKENVERNGLADRIEIIEGDLMEGVDFRADIIVANLMADLVIRLAPAAAEHLDPGGIFISSGILDIKEEIVAEAVCAAGFEIKEVLHDGEWCAIVAKRI
jgi:ribosomal protein L11 methyltransferase